MTVETFISDWWWIGVVIVALVIIIYFARKKGGKKNPESNLPRPCKHNWEYRGCLVIHQDGKDYPRQVLHCKKCCEALHLPIKTWKQLKS